MACYTRSPHQDARSGTVSRIFQTQSRRRSIPKWEREFCLQVGGMQWKEFLKAKKYMLPTCKIMQWDDSEAKECFDNTKYRFWALKYGHTPCDNIHYQNPDTYIDKIDWNSEVDPQLLMELEAALKPVPFDHKEENPVVSRPRCLTGLIVGDKEDGSCIGEQKLANCSIINH